MVGDFFLLTTSQQNAFLTGPVPEWVFDGCRDKSDSSIVYFSKEAEHIYAPSRMQ
jgi:hypothetical protein